VTPSISKVRDQFGAGVGGHDGASGPFPTHLAEIREGLGHCLCHSVDRQVCTDHTGGEGQYLMSVATRLLRQQTATRFGVRHTLRTGARIGIARIDQEISRRRLLKMRLGHMHWRSAKGITCEDRCTGTSLRQLDDQQIVPSCVFDTGSGDTQPNAGNSRLHVAHL